MLAKKVLNGLRAEARGMFSWKLR